MTDESLFKRPSKPPANPTYRTFSEVCQLRNFEPDRFFTKEDYEDTVANYYNPADKEFICHLIRDGVHCKREHKWGYVVLLKDGVYANVGNTCIFERLATTEAITRGTHAFLRQKEHEERIASVKEEAKHVPERIDELELFLSQVNDVQGYLNTFKEDFGGKLYSNLVDRAKRSDTDIVVTGVIVDEDYDEYGEIEYNKRYRKHSLVSIRGLQLFLPDRVKHLRERLQTTLEFYQRFSITDLSQDSTDTEITNAREGLAAYYSHQKDTEALSRDFEHFKQNNFAMLSCLFADYKTRIRILQTHHDRIGSPISKNTAKDRLHAYDSELKNTLDVDQIHYQ